MLIIIIYKTLILLLSFQWCSQLVGDPGYSFLIIYEKFKYCLIFLDGIWLNSNSLCALLASISTVVTDYCDLRLTYDMIKTEMVGFASAFYLLFLFSFLFPFFFYCLRVHYSLFLSSIHYSLFLNCWLNLFGHCHGDLSHISLCQEPLHHTVYFPTVACWFGMLQEVITTFFLTSTC